MVICALLVNQEPLDGLWCPPWVPRGQVVWGSGCSPGHPEDQQWSLLSEIFGILWCCLLSSQQAFPEAENCCGTCQVCSQSIPGLLDWRGFLPCPQVWQASVGLQLLGFIPLNPQWDSWPSTWFLGIVEQKNERWPLGTVHSWGFSWCDNWDTFYVSFLCLIYVYGYEILI